MKIDLRDIPVYYINLARDVKKNSHMISMLNDCGFKKVIRVEGVLVPENSVAGTSSAHYLAIKQSNTPCIILEDDCILGDFQPIINVPKDADAIYLGISSWGRMNGFSGPFVNFENISDNLLRVYNMLGGHAIMYIEANYKELCQRIAYHAGHIIKNHMDIGFAEIQRWHNVYAFDTPFFAQTSMLECTSRPLSSYTCENGYNSNYFYPLPVV